jgi:hypothetical protein
MPEGIRKRLSGKLQRTFRRLQLVYHEYSISILISLCLGIILKVIDLNHELFDNLVSSINKFLHISSAIQVDHSSIISMSATILFTVLAIIFAILIFFTQISYEYTMINIFEEDNVKFLIGLYFTTIVLSLMMLVTTFQYPIFLLTLALACILSLYPFLRNISDKLVFDVGVVKLSVEIPFQIASNNESFTRVKIMSLERICKRSIKENRDNAFIGIVGIYENITKMAKVNQMTEVLRLIGINYSKILECLIFTHHSSRFEELRVSLSNLVKRFTTYSKKEEKQINNKNVMLLIFEGKIHTYVSEYSNIIDINMLKILLVGSPLNAIIKSIKDGFKEDFFNEQVVILCYKSYSKLIDRSTENYQIDKSIIDSLGDLAKESYKHHMIRSLTISMGALFEIGVKDQEEKKSVNSSTLVINKLIEIEDYITPECFEKVYKNFNHISHISWAFGEPKLEPYFDNFKELYHKIKLSQI